MLEVLIIDDNESNILILEDLIQSYMKNNDILEYNLTAFLDSPKALDHVQENKVDIIFLDIMMPDINGFEFLDIVRQDNIEHQPIFVMVTALQGKKFKEKKQELGANAFIIKPVNDIQIKAILDKYVAQIK